MVAGGSRKVEAIQQGKGRLWKASVLTATTREVPTHEKIQCFAQHSPVASIAVLDMTAGQRVKLTLSEIFTLLARAARFTSQSEGDWKHDHAAHIAFLVLSARFEWALEDVAECPLQDAPGLMLLRDRLSPQCPSTLGGKSCST